MADYKDDQTITDDAVLWRNIPPRHFIPDENLGTVRPSSAAFDNDKDGAPMSVSLAGIVLLGQGAPEHALEGLSGFALSSITAGLARSCEQGIASDPQPHNLAHALVFGKKPKSVRKRLARGSYWVIPPPGEFLLA